MLLYVFGLLMSFAAGYVLHQPPSPAPEPKSSNPPSTGAETTAIVALYQNTHKESIRYRDQMLKVTAWTVSIYALMVAGSQLIAIPPTGQTPIKTVAAIAIIALLVGSYIFLWRAHNYFVKNRTLYRRCESRLKLRDEPDLLPEEWRTAPIEAQHWTWDYRMLMAFYCLLIASSALIAGYAIVVLWKSLPSMAMP
jgi:hypothetical protein